MAHEILGEILLSVMHQVGQLVFRLDITNSFFLDETWLIPPRQKFEFVPSKELGICVVYVLYEFSCFLILQLYEVFVISSYSTTN